MTKLSDLAAEIQRVIAEHGDLEVFDTDSFQVGGINVIDNSDDNYDPTWNMPTKFAEVDVCK